MSITTREQARAEDRYEALCELIVEHGASEVQRILGMFDADQALIEEVMDRWHDEHVTNGAGRVEGTVVPDGAEFVATAECGPHAGESRRFHSRKLARHWVLYPDDAALPEHAR
jgi:hypothetical protein